MKKKTIYPYSINSISELHRLLGLSKPQHPLISVINFEEIKCFDDESLRTVSYNFYCIAIKNNFRGKMLYGQNYYDFNEGVMTFFSPKQVITTDIEKDLKLQGFWLVIHPDFIKDNQLGNSIKKYGYFSYAVNEALHLSEKEEIMITNLMKTLHQEYCSIIDNFSQDVIVSQIELLLHYCNRFYNRQFITRKWASKDILIKLEDLLNNHFDNGNRSFEGLPSVLGISEQLSISPSYLSDMLRNLTGQNTRQHIQNKLIEKAKERLGSTNLTVAEIAYQLGFEQPQSFNKLFKSKTNISPLQYRKSAN